MKNKNLKFCDAVIHPGEVANLALPLPELYSCAPQYMPIKVIHGEQEGPCMLIFSTLEGNELNGIEIVNRVVELIDPKKLKGTLIAVPVVNVYGLINYPRTLPSGQSLYKCFPGVENGKFGERLAYVFTQEILKKADYIIELDTGGLNHNILPQVYCNFSNREARRLAKTFQSPVVTNVSLEDNLFRQTTEALNIPLLVYQAGEAMRFDMGAIALGVNGIHNVMRATKMLAENAPECVEEINPIFSQDEEWFIAHKGGILQYDITLGQMIEEDQVLGHIKDPFGADPDEVVRSPRKGIIVGINSTPLIHEGLPIFKVASFLDYDKAENIIEEWDKKQPDSYLG